MVISSGKTSVIKCNNAHTDSIYLLAFVLFDVKFFLITFKFCNFCYIHIFKIEVFRHECTLKDNSYLMKMKNLFEVLNS